MQIKIITKNSNLYIVVYILKFTQTIYFYITPVTPSKLFNH